MLIENTILSCDGFIIKGNPHRNVTADIINCPEMSQSCDISKKQVIHGEEKRRMLSLFLLEKLLVYNRSVS
jgi:hypothetical protein